MAYTVPDLNDYLPGEPLTSAKALAMVENPVAFIEQDSTSPVNIAAPHPYDMKTVGDGSTGLLWDFAVDGAVASITPPDLESGFRYTFSIENVAPSVASDTLQISLYDASLVLIGTKAIAGGITPGSPNTRLLASVNSADAYTGLLSTTTAHVRIPCRRAVLSFVAGRNFGEGQVYLRREQEII